MAGGGRRYGRRFRNDTRVLLFIAREADERGWASWRNAWPERHTLSAARSDLHRLEARRLVKLRHTPGGQVEAVRLTKAGRCVVRALPKEV